MANAVIFDVDGTLINSVELHARAWVEAFADFGHVVDFGQMRRQIGRGADQLMPVFLSEPELSRIGKELKTHRGQMFKDRYIDKVTAFEGVRALFERILADGHQVALASSAEEDELGHYKKVARISDLIERETTADDAAKSKPYPDIFEAALVRLDDVVPDDVVVVGDTPHDAEAALKAGLRTIGLTAADGRRTRYDGHNALRCSKTPPSCWRTTRRRHSDNASRHNRL